jgi:hypothetical protein
MKNFWLIALVASLLTSVLYFSYFHKVLYPDSPSYIAPAENLLAGRGYTGSAFEIAGVKVDADGVPESLRTPGYPLLLALFLWIHAGLKGALLFQHLLRVLIIVSATGFAFRVSHSRRTALLTCVLLTIDFPLLEAANAILTELFFTAVLMIVYWLLWKEVNTSKAPGLTLLAAGLLAGASVLIRPISIFFFLPAAMFLILTRPRQKAQAALIFVAGFACLPGAWAMRNHHAIGRFTVSTISEFNLLEYRAAGSIAVDRPGKFQANLEAAQKELADQACREMLRAYARDCTYMTPAEKSEYYSRLARQVVLQHPFGFLKMSARGAGVMMLDSGSETLKRIVGPGWLTAWRVLLLYTAPVFLLALYGLETFRKRNPAFFWLAVCVVGYFVAISAGPEAAARFRVPFLPIYAILAATGLDSLLTVLKIRFARANG